MKNHSLIERIRSTDSERALEEIYKNYRNEFFQWAVNKHLCSLEEAKDIFQQTVVIFYENIRYGRVTELTSQIKTYLFSIGKNKILELIRQKAKNPAHYTRIDYFDTDYLYSDFDEDYEEELKKVERSLNMLGNPCSDILKNYYYHKRSMKEIAEILDYKNSDTVKNLKYKCLQRLRQIFKS
ncbi:MAG: sigma-70 family RNA polymerase sigma factor [Cytophagales bacterium]|nr:sigma-70 family RNA polymerase sigma factor [Cytophagales bacterium]